MSLANGSRIFELQTYVSLGQQVYHKMFLFLIF